jgi:hypothetical protein
MPKFALWAGVWWTKLRGICLVLRTSHKADALTRWAWLDVHACFSLVRGGSLRMIDDESFHRAPSRRQLEPELFL